MTEILSIGTLTDSPLLGDFGNYILAIYEKGSSSRVDNEIEINSIQSRIEYSICFVDCSLAKFHIANFTDDKFRTNLKTILLQIKPKEIVYLEGKLSKVTMNVAKKLSNPLWSKVDFSQKYNWNLQYFIDNYANNCPNFFEKLSSLDLPASDFIAFSGSFFIFFF